MSAWKAEPGTRVGVHGLCDRDEPHGGHVFWWNEVIDNNGDQVLWECPGQASDCRNCDDRKCMSCVLRYMHDACEDDCPMCCGSASVVGVEE